MCPEFLDFFDPTLEEQFVLLVDRLSAKPGTSLNPASSASRWRSDVLLKNTNGSE